MYNRLVLVSSSETWFWHMSTRGSVFPAGVGLGSPSSIDATNWLSSRFNRSTGTRGGDLVSCEDGVHHVM